MLEPLLTTLERVDIETSFNEPVSVSFLLKDSGFSVFGKTPEEVLDVIKAALARNAALEQLKKEKQLATRKELDKDFGTGIVLQRGLNLSRIIVPLGTILGLISIGLSSRSQSTLTCVPQQDRTSKCAADQTYSGWIAGLSIVSVAVTLPFFLYGEWKRYYKEQQEEVSKALESVTTMNDEAVKAEVALKQEFCQLFLQLIAVSGQLTDLDRIRLGRTIVSLVKAVEEANDLSAFRSSIASLRLLISDPSLKDYFLSFVLYGQKVPVTDTQTHDQIVAKIQAIPNIGAVFCYDLSVLDQGSKAIVSGLLKDSLKKRDLLSATIEIHENIFKNASLLLTRPDVLAAILFFRKLEQEHQNLFIVEPDRMHARSLFFIGKASEENREVVANIKSISVRAQFFQNHRSGGVDHETAYNYFKNNRA